MRSDLRAHPCAKNAQGWGIRRSLETGERPVCPRVPDTDPAKPRKHPQPGIRTTARIANAPSSAATGPIGRETFHRKETSTGDQARTALRHPPPTRPAGLPCRPALPRSSPGHPHRQDGAPADTVRPRLGFLTPNPKQHEPHLRGAARPPQMAAKRKTLSTAPGT